GQRRPGPHRPARGRGHRRFGPDHDRHAADAGRARLDRPRDRNLAARTGPPSPRRAPDQRAPAPPGPGAAVTAPRPGPAPAARADGWAVMMDRLRDINAELWGGLTLAERARFLRRLRPWWDVHRHRVAAEPAARIRALAEAGRLTVVAGRLKAIEPGADGVVVRWRPRGSGADQAIRAGHVIDCTGPGHDPARAEDALTRQLLQSGRAQPAPLGLGLDV